MNKKTVLICIIEIIVLHGLYIVWITAANLIPSSLVYENIEKSYKVMEKEGVYPSVYGIENNRFQFYDNYSCSILLNIIYNQNSEHPLKNAVVNYFIWQEEEETPIDGLENAIYHNKEMIEGRYTNFWLGILLPLKLLLTIFSLQEIRYLLCVVFCVFMFLNMIIMIKKISWKFAMAFGVTIILFGMQSNAGDLSAASDLFLLQISVLWLLTYIDSLKDNLKDKCKFFFLIGSLQFFMCYVYAQMLVLGSMLVVSLVLERQNNIATKKRIKHIVAECVSWIMGYGITAMLKQFLAYLFTNEMTGMNKLARWSGTSIKSKFMAFSVQARFIVNHITLFLLLTAVVIITVMLVTHKFYINWERVKSDAFLVLISFIPVYVWFFILSGAVAHGFYIQNYFPVVWMVIFLIIDGIEYNKRTISSYRK